MVQTRYTTVKLLDVCVGVDVVQNVSILTSCLFRYVHDKDAGDLPAVFTGQRKILLGGRRWQRWRTCGQKERRENQTHQNHIRQHVCVSDPSEGIVLHRRGGDFNRFQRSRYVDADIRNSILSFLHSINLVCWVLSAGEKQHSSIHLGTIDSRIRTHIYTKLHKGTNDKL